MPARSLALRGDFLFRSLPVECDRGRGEVCGIPTEFPVEGTTVPPAAPSTAVAGPLHPLSMVEGMCTLRGCLRRVPYLLTVSGLDVVPVPGPASAAPWAEAEAEASAAAATGWSDPGAVWCASTVAEEIPLEDDGVDMFTLLIDLHPFISASAPNPVY